MSVSVHAGRRTCAVLLGVAAALVLFLTLLASSASALEYEPKELDFLALINQYREDEGLDALLLCDALSDASEKHASDMAKFSFFDHSTVRSDFFPAGSTPWDRIRMCGYDYYTNMGENIAAGQMTAQTVFEAWKASPSHDANMLNTTYRVIGIGLVRGGPYGYYWATDFGGYEDATSHPAGSEPPSTTTTTDNPQASARFADVVETHPYYSQIGDLADRGVISGFPGGLFRPENPVTRQQFAKMLVRSMGWSIPASYSLPFTDVCSGLDAGDPLYPDRYVAALAAYGITEGCREGERLSNPIPA